MSGKNRTTVSSPSGLTPQPERPPRGHRRQSYCASEARRHDPDRFRVALFAPPDRREALFALCAFNHEIAKIRETVSEPLLGSIRLQWWREAIAELYAGRPRRHEVVRALAAVVTEHGLGREHFDRLIDGREFDLDEAAPESLHQLEEYAEATSATLVRLGLEALAGESGQAAGEAPQAAARAVGVAWALVGLMRALPVHLRQRKIYLPKDLCAEAGLRRSDLLDLRQPEKTAGVVAAVTERAEALLAEARRHRLGIVRPLRRGLLLARLADRHLQELRRPGREVFTVPAPSPPGRDILRLSLAALRHRF